MPTDTFYPAYDGRARWYDGVETSWSTVRGKTTATDKNDATDPDALCYSSQAVGPGALIIRGFYSFDTSPIPSGATITSATLSFYGTSVVGTVGAVCVVEGQQASGTALATSDFPSKGSTELTTARINVSSWSTSGYNDFTLNSTGLGLISTTGYTKFCVLHSSDLDNSAPASSAAAYASMSEHTGTSQDPKLVVTYTADASVTAVPLAASVTLPAPPMPRENTDSFTDSNGTDLTTHTPESGSWAVFYDGGGPQTLKVWNNRAYPSNAGGGATAEYRHSETFTDGYVEADFYAAGSGGYGLISMRSTGTATSTTQGTHSCYRVIFDHGGVSTNGNLVLQKLISGTATTLDTYSAGAFSGTHTVRLSCNGTAIKVNLNETEVISVTDSSITGSGATTLHLNSSDGASQTVGVHADRFLVDATAITLVTSPALAVAVALPAPAVTATSPNVTVTSPALAVASTLRSPAITAELGYLHIRGTGNARTVSGSASLVIAGGTIGTTSAHRAFPTFTKAANGNLVMHYRRGTTEPSQDGVICQVVSTDLGATWGSESVVFGSSLGGDRGVFRQCNIKTLASGRLAALFCQHSADVPGPNSKYRTWYSYSDDHGSTWSTPAEVTFSNGGGFDRTVGSGAFGDDLLELPNGDLLAFAYGRDLVADTTWYEQVAKSTDDGATWSYLSTMAVEIGGFNSLEAQAVLLDDGTIYATFHTEDGVPTDIYETRSTDSGVTWSTPVRIFTGVASNRNDCLLTPDGDLIQAYAASASSYAQGIRQSFDDGATFGSFITAMSPPGVWTTPDWISPNSIAGEGVSPNVGVAMGQEKPTQETANVYWAAFTASNSFLGGDATKNLAVAVALPAPSVSTTIGGGSVSVTSPALAVAGTLPAPAVTATGGATIAGVPLAVSVTLPSPVIVTTIGVVTIVVPPLAVRATLPAPNSTAETGYRWFRTRRRDMSTPVKTYVQVIPKGTARTSSFTSQTFDAKTEAGILVVLDVTSASGTGGLTVRINAHDQASSQAIALNAAPTAVTATGTTSYALYPFGAIAGNVTQATSFYLPRLFSISVTHGDSSSYTYSLGYCLLP